MSLLRRRPLVRSTLLASTLLLAACGGEGPTADEGAPGEGAYPLTVENCGEQVTIERRPERAIVLGSSPIPLLEAAGAFDQVLAKAGEFPDGLFDEATREAVAAIPEIGGGEDAGGTVIISQEEVIDQQPDLVIGHETETVTRAGLAGAGITMLILPGFCPDPAHVPTDQDFDDVDAQVEFWGEVFGNRDEAAASVADLRARVEAATAAAAEEPDRTGATLFVPVGGGQLRAYGTGSMAHPQMAAAGIENVFGDVDDRRFEVSVEELLDRDPDVLVLLHVEGEPDAVIRSLAAQPGAGQLAAVREGAIYVQLFGFTDPPTPLSVDGLERMLAHFAG